MSLTEIARFADLAEAQIAASRLRAEGVPVLLQNEHWGANDYLMTIAMGGFRLWAPDAEADEARRLIEDLRRAPADAETTPETSARPDVLGLGVVATRAGAALLLAATCGPAAGLLLDGKRRNGWLGGAAIGVAALCLLAVAALWLPMFVG
ncbi:MAG: DUF2007 domain-containing protein [Caulobacter sp.]